MVYWGLGSYIGWMEGGLMELDRGRKGGNQLGGQSQNVGMESLELLRSTLRGMYNLNSTAFLL